MKLTKKRDTILYDGPVASPVASPNNSLNHAQNMIGDARDTRDTTILLLSEGVA